MFPFLIAIGLMCGLSKLYLLYILCLDLLSYLLKVRWLFMMVMVMVMGDGDEEDAGVLYNLLKGLDELPSWRDGVLPHSCP